MIATSAPAPVPSSSTFAFITNVPRRPRSEGNAQEREREALAGLASIARNVCYDLQRGKCSPVTPDYLMSIGLQLLELADESRSIRPRDWDRIIDRITFMGLTDE